MKKTILLLITLFTTVSISAQILAREAVNNNTGANSLAFIDGTSNPGYNTAGANYAGKGILFPSMDLSLSGAPFDQATVGGASYNPNYYDGLVVYNTGTGAVTMGTSAADVAPGFYYYANPTRTAWDGGTWTPMGGGAAGGTNVSDTPTTSATINGEEELVVRVEGVADGNTTHLDLSAALLPTGITVGTFRLAKIFNATTGAAIMEATGAYDSVNNTFVTGNGMMNFLLDSGTYTVELYYLAP